MAGIVARRLVLRNLPRLKELFVLRPYHSASVLIIRFDHSGCLYNDYSNRNFKQQTIVKNQRESFVFTPLAQKRWLSTKENKNVDDDKGEKLSLVQRFKKMYSEYWYVLLPVHLVTSAVWFGSFYYLAKSGVDIVGLLESWHVSEKITNPLKGSNAGYIAIAYALYKIATPVRYTITLGGTTISINYLKKWGYIKPVPSAEQLKKMYQEKKGDFMEGLKVQSEKLKDKNKDFMNDIDKSITHMKHLSHQIKPKEPVLEKVKKDVKGHKK